MKEFAYKYGQILVGVSIAICIFGLCVGYATVKGEIEELVIPGRREY